MRLSPHFTLEELTHSDEAQKLSIVNTPTPEALANLRITALGLEMARLVLNRPLLITSGYRNPEVNAAVRGTPTSDHMSGYCADFTAPGLTPFEAARLLEHALPYDQLILETSRHIVHISFDPQLRGQALTQRRGSGTPLEPGINL